MIVKNAVVVLVAGVATLIGSSARAHIPFVEPEAREDSPESLPEGERATKDYSFDNPFPLPEDVAFQEMHDFAYDGIDSMAVNGYLIPDEVDVFRLVPAENDSGALPFPGAILASALPPACGELVERYPVVALIGPGLPREPEVLEGLPFDIDDENEVPQSDAGMNGALFAPNPTVDPREVFVEDVVVGLSWFLPDGLTQACLEGGNPFIDCPDLTSNTIVAIASEEFADYDLMLGESYYVAVWDPEGEAQDYTVTLGITDAHYVDRPDVNEEIKCFNLVHGECTPPYEEMPEGYFSDLCEDKSGGETGNGGGGGCSVRAQGGGSAPWVVALVLFAAALLRRRLLRH